MYNLWNGNKFSDDLEEVFSETKLTTGKILSMEHHNGSLKFGVEGEPMVEAFNSLAINMKDVYPMVLFHTESLDHVELINES